ncbi:helix-turn-helix transcriptional regulator [Cytobacillus oceanisediminis]|uniref:helix-turn-helix domain-containing protein n=1 Tax=Cytobacillus oceanisediminis TaxID=665099 RepID=UPI0023DA5F17|nr:helix-turn-helix transcriptional regulator [Cytobacillus oceanisediminis]MDF2038402.1 helix-turn-helix transcriptional regulator [Cytobacillus oceanisediminis]
MNVALFQEIQAFMQLKKWNKTQLSKKSGIHISEISRILNNKQPLSLQNLDAITNAFGLSEGSLYTYYVEECLNEGNRIDKRRSIQFLYKCAAEGRKKHYSNLIDLMLEENSKTLRKKNLLYIFSVAEELFQAEKGEQALPLYEVIIENDSDRFSENAAISYFRRFYIVRMTDIGQHALAHVLDQLAYMPIDIRKEAYLWIMADYYRCENWKKVLFYAEKLKQLAAEGEYYGRALMYKSFALTRLGASLEEVLDLIAEYAHVNEFFSDIAAGNRYVALLDFGKLEYVDEYLSWLETRDDIYAGLPRILESYVRLDRLEDAKKLIERFKHVINDMAMSKEPWLKEKMYWDFRYAHALLQCKSNQVEKGLIELLEVAALSNSIGNIERFKKCLLAFWQYRFFAAPHHEEKYTQLLSTGNNH